MAAIAQSHYRVARDISTVCLSNTFNIGSGLRRRATRFQALLSIAELASQSMERV
jgi:hypothetical protein